MTIDMGEMAGNSVAVGDLGYVGLPFVRIFGRMLSAIGFDILKARGGEMLVQFIRTEALKQPKSHSGKAMSRSMIFLYGQAQPSLDIVSAVMGG